MAGLAASCCSSRVQIRAVPAHLCRAGLATAVACSMSKPIPGIIHRRLPQHAAQHIAPSFCPKPSAAAKHTALCTAPTALPKPTLNLSVTLQLHTTTSQHPQKHLNPAKTQQTHLAANATGSAAPARRPAPAWPPPSNLSHTQPAPAAAALRLFSEPSQHYHNKVPTTTATATLTTSQYIQNPI